MITEFQQETSDFDWFFTNGINIGHVASGGGRLPLAVAKSSENLELLVEFFWELPPSSDFIINPQLKMILKTSRVTDIYLSSYIYMAERGVFAFDKTIPNNFIDTNYHLVVKPTNPINLSELPQHISDIIFNYGINPDRTHLDTILFDEK